ncbi:MAG: hypothetical protein VX871_01955 [Pseudomonadota bacterium]|nr:hypothetical protein [Pseudomonadota bacterium]
MDYALIAAGVSIVIAGVTVTMSERLANFFGTIPAMFGGG